MHPGSQCVLRVIKGRIKSTASHREIRRDLLGDLESQNPYSETIPVLKRGSAMQYVERESKKLKFLRLEPKEILCLARCLGKDNVQVCVLG